jgi:hypothetical protein
MKKLFVCFAFIATILLGSCSSQSGLAQEVSSVLPTEEATALAESMASKLGLSTVQKSSVYTSLLNYYTKKKDLVTQVKNNQLTQAAMTLAESKLSAEKNSAIKSVMTGGQLSSLASLFGIN